MVPNKKKHITILSVILANGGTISNTYIFKGVRARKKYITFCKEGAIIRMQKGVDGQAPLLTMDGPFLVIIDQEGGFLT